MSDALETEGDNALVRVFQRKLALKKGWTEITRIRGGHNWSTRARTVQQARDIFLGIHNRIVRDVLPVARAAVGDANLANIVTTNADEVIGRYRSLRDEVEELPEGPIDNTTPDRNQALQNLERLIELASGIKFKIIAAPSLSQNVDMLANVMGPKTKTGRFLISHPDQLQDILATLPPQRESARVLEAIEDAFFDTREGLPAAAHEVIFRRKTDILEAVIHDRIEASTDPNLACLKNYPPDQYWKILIDGKNHDSNDKHCYTRSLGYMAGMMSGFERIIETVGQHITPEFIADLHAAMTRHVTTESMHALVHRNALQQQGYKTIANAWSVTIEHSPDGMAELKTIMDELNEILEPFIDEESKKQGADFSIDVAEIEKYLPEIYGKTNDNEAHNAKPQYLYLRETVEKGGGPDKVEVPYYSAGVQGRSAFNRACAQKLVEEVVAMYHREIASVAGDNEKLRVIIDLCRRLAEAHPFADANGRVINFGVLNKLLLDNGMPPTTLNDQAYMMGKSSEELCRLIREGQDKLTRLKSV